MVRVERTAGHKLEGLPVIAGGRYVQAPFPLFDERPAPAEGGKPERVPINIFDLDPITARFALDHRAPDGSPYFRERAGEGPTRALAEGETLKK